MLSFYWPWLALLFPLPILVYFVWPRIYRQNRVQKLEGGRVTLNHPSLASLNQAFNGKGVQSYTQNKRLSWLRGFLWVMLVLAVMRPQWIQTVYQQRIDGHDVILAVDTSRSMTALDFSIEKEPMSRIRGVKQVMKGFVKQRVNDRIGLVVFADTAFVQSPLTLDSAAVLNSIDAIEAGMIGYSTAMGDAIALSVKKLSLRAKQSRILILITDGENTSGTIAPLSAVEYAKQEQVKIYTIGVGSNNQRVAMLGVDGRYAYEEEVGIDEDLLKNISALTGGEYYRATHHVALADIYQQIDQLQKSPSYEDFHLVAHPLYRWPLAVIMLLWLMMGLMPQARVTMGVQGD